MNSTLVLVFKIAEMGSMLIFAGITIFYMVYTWKLSAAIKRSEVEFHGHKWFSNRTRLVAIITLLIRGILTGSIYTIMSAFNAIVCVYYIFVVLDFDRNYPSEYALEQKVGYSTKTMLFCLLNLAISLSVSLFLQTNNSSY